MTSFWHCSLLEISENQNVGIFWPNNTLSLGFQNKTTINNTHILAGQSQNNKGNIAIKRAAYLLAIIKIHLSCDVLRLLMLHLKLYTDLSVCSAIVGASYNGASYSGALIANLSEVAVWSWIFLLHT